MKRMTPKEGAWISFNSPSAIYGLRCDTVHTLAAKRPEIIACCKSVAYKSRALIKTLTQRTWRSNTHRGSTFVHASPSINVNILRFIWFIDPKGVWTNSEWLNFRTEIAFAYTPPNGSRHECQSLGCRCRLGSKRECRIFNFKDESEKEKSTAT